MFGNNDEKRIVREIDRIVSMKEDVDALSWGRVLEIGRRLQTDRSDGETPAALGRELIDIAQSNISLIVRLGIDPQAAGDFTTPSQGETNRPPFETSVTKPDTGALESSLADASAAFTEMLLSDRESEFGMEFEPDEGLASDRLPLCGDVEQDFSETDALPMGDEAVSSDATSSGKPTVPEEVHAPHASSGRQRPPDRFACFRNIYESRDGGLCVFEDEQGHLMAVDTSRLA